MRAATAVSAWAAMPLLEPKLFREILIPGQAIHPDILLQMQAQALAQPLRPLIILLKKLQRRDAVSPIQ